MGTYCICNVYQSTNKQGLASIYSSDRLLLHKCRPNHQFLLYRLILHIKALDGKPEALSSISCFLHIMTLHVIHSLYMFTVMCKAWNDSSSVSAINRARSPNCTTVLEEHRHYEDLLGHLLHPHHPLPC